MFDQPDMPDSSSSFFKQLNKKLKKDDVKLPIYFGIGLIALFLITSSLAPEISKRLGLIAQKKAQQQTFAQGPEKEDKFTKVKLATESLKAAGWALRDDRGRRGKAAPHIVPLSKQRKSDLLALLDDDPQAAVGLILPDEALSTFADLPAVAVEKKVTLTGTFVIFHRHYPDDTSTFQPQIIVSDETFDLYTNGRFPNIKAGDAITLTGYKLNKKVLMPVQHPAETVEVKGADNKVLGAVTGPIATAVIVANFSDSTTPLDIAKIQTAFEGNAGHDVVSFFNEASYEKMSIVPSFYGPYTLSATSSSCASSANLSELKNAANADVNYLNFRRFIYVLNCNYGGSTGVGEGNVSTPDGIVPNAAPIWIGYLTPFFDRNYDPEVYAHELGHTLANRHASFFNCNPQDFVPPTNFGEDDNCLTAEYMDKFDTMGSPPYAPTGTFPWGVKEMPHLNPYHKANAGWFDAGKYQTVTTSGTYIIGPYESSSSSVLALNIPRSNSGTSFTVEYRQPVGFDSFMNTSSCPNCNVVAGASIRLSGYQVLGGGGSSDTEMIDNTPGTIKGNSFWGGEDLPDGALLPGKTFTDPEYGIAITTQSADASGLTVQVEVPTSCIHNQPTYTLANADQSAAAGQTLNYIVTFTNKDSANCPNNQFKVLTRELTLNSKGPVYGFSIPFKITSSPDVFTLAPGASTDITMSVTSPPNLPASTYRAELGQRVIIQSNQLGVPYTYVINFSYQVTAPADSTGPSAPTEVTATATGAKTINVSFPGATDNVAVVGYKVLVNGSFLYFTETSQFIYYAANPNTAYTFSVRSYDAKGNLSSEATTTVTTPAATDTQAPSAPVTTSASATARTITLNWAPSTDNVGVAGYLVNSGLAKLIYLPASATSVTFDKLRTNTTYTYQVQAFDADGNYSNFYNWGSWQTITTAFEGQTPPPAPATFYSPQGTASGLVLAWSAVGQATSYKIYRSGKLIGQVSGTSYTDTNISGISAFSYSIKAVDANGNVSPPLPRYVVPLSYTGTFLPPSGWKWTPSSSLSSSDVSAPTVSMSGISEGQSTSGTVNIGVSAADDVGVKEVGFYLDGERILTNKTSPFGFSWDTTQIYNGSHWVYVAAYDARGNHGSTVPITITVNNGLPSPTPTPTPSETPTPTPEPTPTPTPTPTPAPVDSDGDGFSDFVEGYVGTDPNLKCGDNAWPPDINNDRYVDITDISRVSAAVGQTVTDSNRRLDLNADGFIDISDKGIVANYFGRTCI